MGRVGYLGPDGSYSQLAAVNMCGDGELAPFARFTQGFKKLEEGYFDAIVVPIENTLNGGVVQNIDLLQASDAVAVRECTVKIDHRLATLESADLTKIKYIYSHQQALEQCGRYLTKNYPNAEVIPTFSTAAGLEKLASDEDACMAGAHIGREGIKLSEQCISDEKRNFTRFLLIRRGSVDETNKSSKIYFSLTCNNRTGALSELLLPIAANGLNMTKIESRPIKERPEEYRFFIETEGDYSSREVRKILEVVKAAAIEFKLLGCY